jgi:DNA-binding response OmpR family regulator
MKKILIIEDNPAVIKGLQTALTDEHFETLTATDGEKGYQMARRENIDFIILDILLPKKNGLDVCRDLRKDGISIPILMLTSKKGETDEIVGFEIGANDYMTKPFSVPRLIARVRNLLRVQIDKNNEIDVYTFDDVVLDFKKQESTKAGEPIELSTKEFEILKYFIAHEGEVISRDDLLNAVWGYETFPTTRTVDNYILSIRKKIETQPSHPNHLLTIHTAGYKFVKA